MYALQERQQPVLERETGSEQGSSSQREAPHH